MNKKERSKRKKKNLLAKSAFTQSLKEKIFSYSTGHIEKKGKIRKWMMSDMELNPK